MIPDFMNEKSCLSKVTQLEWGSSWSQIGRLQIQKCPKTQQEGSWGWRPLSCCSPPEAGLLLFTFRLLTGQGDTCSSLFSSVPTFLFYHHGRMKNKERKPSHLNPPSQCLAPIATEMRKAQTLVGQAGSWSRAPGARVWNTDAFASGRTDGWCLPMSSLWTQSSGLWEVTLYGNESYGEGILLSSTHV